MNKIEMASEKLDEDYVGVLRDLEAALLQNDEGRIKQLIKANETFLYFAVQNNLLKIVKELIKYGADVNTEDSNGITPLHVAAQYASKEAVSVLLQNGAMYNAEDDLATKPIDIAMNEEISTLLRSTEKLFKSALSNNVAAVERNFKVGAPPGAKDVEGCTALHYAACKGFGKVVETFLDHNADINVRDCDGMTPLHYAVSQSRISTVQLLLFRGALFDAVDESGKTPSHLCKKKVLSNLFKLIRTCFQKILANDETVINDITKIAFFETKKAVLGAKNNEGKTLTVEAILRKFSKLDEFKMKLQPDVSAKLTTGVDLLRKGQHQLALKTFESAWQERNRLLGPGNPFTLDVQFHIAYALSKLGRYQESLKTYQHVCNKQTEIFGYDAVETLNTRSYIALLMVGLGNVEDACERMTQINKMRDVLCGSDDENLKALFDKALVLEVGQKHDEAIEVYKSIRNNFIMKLKGGESSKTLLILETIGMIQFSLGKYKESLETLKEVLSHRVLLGSDHPDTIKTMLGIHYVLAELKMPLKEATAAYKEILNVKLLMASMLRSQKKLLNALKVFGEVQEPLEAVYGANNSKVLDCLHEMRATKKMLKSLAVDGSEVLQRNKDGLMTAVMSDNVDRLTYFLSRDGCPDINAKDEKGRTPLHLAVLGGHLKIVDALIARGADVTLATVKGNTPLHIAVAKGSMDIVKILSRHAMSLRLYNFIDAKTAETANTALHIAAKNQQFEILKLLLACGATYEIFNDDGQKPVDLATDVKVRNLLKLIEDLFAVVDDDGFSAMVRLSSISPDEFPSVVKARNLEGATLMKVAADCKRREIVNFLSRKVQLSF